MIFSTKKKERQTASPRPTCKKKRNTLDIDCNNFSPLYFLSKLKIHNFNGLGEKTHGPSIFTPTGPTKPEKE